MSRVHIHRIGTVLAACISSNNCLLSFFFVVVMRYLWLTHSFNLYLAAFLFFVFMVLYGLFVLRCTFVISD